MRVVFDIMHPAHINFFSNLIKKLQANQVEVEVMVLDRGKVVKIFEREYSNVPYKVVGKYSDSVWGLFIKTGFFRTMSLFFRQICKPADCFIGVTAFQLGAVSKFKRKTKSIIVYDDPEHKLNFNLSKLIANQFFMPKFCKATAENIFHFNCLKEWAYLSPKYLKPKKSALEKYNLKPYGYIFIREVDTKSLNYRGQEQSMMEALHEADLPYPVVLSIENKKRVPIYKNWIILEEPVEDIHSLMYYSNILISDGDSMAREGGMLGVKSIYCGIRKMNANLALIEQGLMEWVKDPQELVKRTKELLAKRTEEDAVVAQKEVREKLQQEWDDVNEVIYRAITQGETS